jgi:dolichyl-phosphate-mannose--protein O-mannosyl transferase
MLRLVSSDPELGEASEEQIEEVDPAPLSEGRDWSGRDTVALIVVTLVAGFLRLVRVADPRALVFDETYYAKDACWYVNVSERICDTATEITQVHPPLSKWIIAIGIRLFGHDSFGWRISAVVFGTIAVALLYLLARKLLLSTTGATIASGLLAIDFLHFVQSRIAMLDVFSVTFGIACILFVVYDRDRLLKTDRPPDRLRSWRLAAGIAGGAATACKWTGAFFLVMAVILVIAWEWSARRRDGGSIGSTLRGLLLQESLTIVFWLVVLPIVVYAVTFFGRIEWSDGSLLKAFIDRHRYMVDFHANLESHHSYESPAWSWLLLKRPVSYFFETDSQDRYKEIFATGNPFVWWPAVLAVFYAAFRWLRARSNWGPEAVIVLGFIATYVTWFLLSLTGRSATFLFYVLPTVPFLCLALGYVAARIGRSWEARTAIGLFSLGAIGLFAFYYPLLANVAIPQPEWDRRIWAFDKCDVEGIETTADVTQTSNGKVTTFATTTMTTESLPPKGWCWI